MDDVLKLYVFDGADIKKCYQCDAYDVRLATVEDVAQALRVDRMDAVSRDEIRKAAARCPGKIHDALLDMFDGLTAEEAEQAMRWNVADVFRDLFAWFYAGLKSDGSGAEQAEQEPDDMTLPDALFEIKVNICNSFPAMDPIRLRQEKCGEVLLLLRQMIRYNRVLGQRKALSGEGGAPAVPLDDDVIVVRKKNGDTVTMRRAKDDRRW
ncbi:MAG: hypothetical protein IKB58_00915 [Oscillospiraceae bacterium]|nr:hypothetical protein [Oscillospiraceae bacterium]